jgi:hypothetical protein
VPNCQPHPNSMLRCQFQSSRRCWSIRKVSFAVDLIARVDQEGRESSGIAKWPGNHRSDSTQKKPLMSRRARRIKPLIRTTGSQIWMWRRRNGWPQTLTPHLLALVFMPRRKPPPATRPLMHPTSDSPSARGSPTTQTSLPQAPRTIAWS